MAFRMPAEWERQEAIWLAWPHNREDWPDRFGPIPWAYVEIIRVIAAHERVRLVVKNARQQDEAASCLTRAGVSLGQIDFLVSPTDRVWLRDSGAICVYDGAERVLLDWKFNAWAKYDNWKRDDKIPALAESFLGLRRVQPHALIDGKRTRLVLEGGSIDVNGQGTLLTTEECLLSDVQCRNPGLTREGYETAFREYLGVEQVIWLENGIAGDDTHGHVDDLARFVGPSTVVTCVQQDENDADYAPLQTNLKRLREASNQDGKAFDVITLPMPRPVLFEEQRLPASYANFLIINGAVLVPTFNDPADRVALGILADCMPEREITGIYCGDFVWGLGTIHCASQQEPSILKSKNF